jgi:SAM-dependent methyltransferase
VSDGRGLKFGTVAENYDLYRAGPPPEAATMIGDLNGKDVLDVGAGTGKLTRFLLALGANVTAIEPDEEMLAILVRRSPEVTVLEGSGELIPAPDASFDAAFSSSAWHWFTQPDATNEHARVLRDGAGLFVWWNGFSRDVEWVDELTKLRERPGDANARPRGWRAELDPDGPFVDAQDFDLDWTWSRTIDQVVGSFTTYSGTFVLSDDERRGIAEEVRLRLERRFPDGQVRLPMTLRGTNARRRPR